MSEWINTRERLPSDKSEVLATLELCHCDKIEFMTYDSEKIQWCWVDRNLKHYRKRKVIYWMPLSKLPEES